MVKKTRKASKGIQSIPLLRRSFEHIETYGRGLAQAVHNKTMSKNSASVAYGKEWKKTFGRALPTKSAQASVEHYILLAPASKSKRGRTLKGGDATSPHPSEMNLKGGQAPVEQVVSDLQPGIYAAPTLPGQVVGQFGGVPSEMNLKGGDAQATPATGFTAYGNFLDWVDKGFNAVTWKDSLQATCCQPNTIPTTTPPGMGDNRVIGWRGGAACSDAGAPWPIKSDVTPPGSVPLGATTWIKPGPGLSGGSVSSETGDQTLRGKRKTRRHNKKQNGGNAALAFAFRPLVATNPTSVGHDAMMGWKGQGFPASPDPTDMAASYKAGNVIVPKFDDLSAINRDLPGKDVTSA